MSTLLRCCTVPCCENDAADTAGGACRQWWADEVQNVKGKTERTKYHGITGSHSRPRVSNDNPFVESLFRTLKYVAGWPPAGCTGLDEAKTMG